MKKSRSGPGGKAKTSKTRAGDNGVAGLSVDEPLEAQGRSVTCVAEDCWQGDSLDWP